MALAWEVPVKAQTREACSASMFRPKMTIKEVLAVDKVAKPATLLQIAKTGDTVGIKRMIDAKCSVKEATTSFGLSALHFCAIRNFADTADVILKAY